MGWISKKVLLKGIKSFLLKVIKNLPPSIRGRISRSFVNITYEYPPDFVVKLAETEEEYLQAFAVIHNAYHKKSLIQGNETSLRATKYHAIPQTVLVIAKSGNEVIGTVSHILDSSLGLPIEELLDISGVRKNYSRIGEISSFAIKHEFFHKKYDIIFALTRFLFHYASSYLHVKCWVIATHPSVANLYTDIFGFHPLEQKVFSYGSLGNAEAYCQYLELDRQVDWFKKVYSGASMSKDVNEAHVGESLRPFMQYPKREYYSASDWCLTPYQVDFFFNKKTSTFKGVSAEDKYLMQELFFYEEYRRAFAEKMEPNSFYKRDEKRFLVSCPGRLSVEIAGESVIQIYGVFVLDASINGLLVHSEKKLNENIESSLLVEVGPNKKVRLAVKCVWSRGDHFYGFRIIGGKTTSWLQYISYLEQRLGRGVNNNRRVG